MNAAHAAKAHRRIGKTKNPRPRPRGWARKTIRHEKGNTAAGASLIVVLGLLATLTVLAAAFAYAMRVARLTGRQYAEEMRARHLVHTALVRAIEAVDQSMRGYTFPFWGDRYTNAPCDAFCSAPGGPSTEGRLWSGEALSLVPHSLWPDAQAAAIACGWEPVGPPGGPTNGRVAYLVINCSGLLDANVLLGGEGPWATNLVWALDDIKNPLTFFEDGRLHIRYETLAELTRLNQGVTESVSNLWIFSLDPGPDFFFESTNRLGCTDISLFPRFAVNAGVSFTDYTDPAFRTNYWAPLTNLLARAGYANPASVGWNLVNYLDTNRVPDNPDVPWPWLSAGGTEAVPYVNELVLSTEDTTNRLQVELWFPFWPAVVSEDDGFSLAVGWFTNTLTANPSHILSLAAQTNGQAIGAMSWDTNAFRVYSFELTNAAPVSSEAPIRVIARVLHRGTPVSEAMGYEASGYPACLFTNAMAWAAVDPRLSAHPENWVSLPLAFATPGAQNPVCDPWAHGGQGIPIIHRDGPMEGIGEIGYVFTPPGCFATNSPPWRSVDLFSEPGATLLDWMTISNRGPTRGLTSLSTRQTGVTEALFACAQTSLGAEPAALQPQAWAAALASGAPYLTCADALLELAAAPGFSALSVKGHTSGDIKEDAVRHLPERMTFRQNLFMIFLAAQPLAHNGRPTAEKHAVALLWRDAYTGLSFARFFKWLRD